MGGLVALEKLDMTGCRGDAREHERKVWQAIKERREAIAAEEKKTPEQRSVKAAELEAKAKKLIEEAEKLIRRVEEMKREAEALQKKAAELREPRPREKE